MTKLSQELKPRPAEIEARAGAIHSEKPEPLRVWRAVGMLLVLAATLVLGYVRCGDAAAHVDGMYGRGRR